MSTTTDKIAAITTCLMSHGYTQDRWGHWRKECPPFPDGAGREYRYKISQCAVRKELRCNGRWIRLRGAYLKDITINSANRIEGLK